jgi:hypothetical protein
VWKSEGSANTLQELKQKLLSVSDKLSKWGIETFGHIRSELKKLNVELERLRLALNRTGPTHEEIKIADRIVELNNREEIMWRQRSRIQYLASGDKNTRFFDLRASLRKKKNKITRLKKSNGQVTEDAMEMGTMTSDFYKVLYTSEGTSGMEHVLRTVPTKVTREMNDKLLLPFGEAEVKEALFHMFPTKASGPDGFPAHFSNVTGVCVGRK